MDLEHLRYFQTVAEYQHITHAAEELHISQPSLSKAISNVEAFAGTELFRRERNKIYLNECGQIFSGGITHFFSILDQARLQIQKSVSLENGLVRIATSLGSGVLNDYLVALHHRYPDILITQSLTQEQDMLQDLTQEQADFAISASPLSQYSSQFKSTLLLEDEMLLLIPDSNPLSRQKSVSMEQLKDQRFVFNNSGMELRASLIEVIQNTGVMPNIIFESSSPDLIGQLMKQEECLTMIPLSAYIRMQPRSSDSGVSMHQKAVHLSGPWFRRRIWLSYNPDAQRSRAADLAISELPDYFSDFEADF